MLSIEIVPTIGWRRPPTSTSALLVSAAADAVAVADREHADAGLAAGARQRRP